MSDINRKEVDRDEKGNKIQNVQSSTFVQNPNNNSDITQNPIELYYTDLDIQDNAELFINASDASIKAQNMLHKFPNHIIKFYMFYYTEQYRNGELIGVKKELCQVVPGTRLTAGSEQEKRDYRQVKRKSLKSVYDKIDFITIYRPLNGVKWYTVSKDELNTELAVIKEFYGLTNFPDKTGDFYFSKKIGKWLATNELSSILQGYKDGGQEVPIIYPDEIVDGYIKAEKKSILEIIWDYIVQFFTGIGDIIGGLLGIDNDKIQQRLENFWNGLKDTNGNWIPDGIDAIIENYKLNVIQPDVKDVRDGLGGNASTPMARIEALKTELGGTSSLSARIEALKTELGNYNFDVTNGIIGQITKKFENFINDLDSSRKTQGWGFVGAIWNKFVDWIKSILNLDFEKDEQQ